jgi:hypothetical protein
MARIAGADRGRTPLSKLIFYLVRRRLRRVPVPTRIMALRPGLLRGGALMELSQESASLVPARLKKLAQTLVASRVGCPF